MPGPRGGVGAPGARGPPGDAGRAGEAGLVGARVSITIDILLCISQVHCVSYKSITFHLFRVYLVALAALDPLERKDLLWVHNHLTHLVLEWPKVMCENMQAICIMLCEHSSPLHMPYSRVPLVKMVAPDPLAQLDPEASPVTLDSLVPKGLL